MMSVTLLPSSSQRKQHLLPGLNRLLLSKDFLVLTLQKAGQRRRGGSAGLQGVSGATAKWFGQVGV